MDSIEKRTALAKCFTVAFYGLSATDGGLTSYYEHLIEWFGKNKLSLDMLSVHGPGFSGKPGSFARNDRRLRRSGFKNIESVHLYSMTDDGSIPVLHWVATADVIRSKAVAVLSVDLGVVSWSRDATLSFSRTAIELLRPSYGIGYSREKRVGPALYAIGLVHGLDAFSGPEYEESLLISRWGDTAMPTEVYKTGLQRDVYPMNFLTAPHLARPIQGSPLAEWVAKEPTRGRVTQ